MRERVDDITETWPNDAHALREHHRLVLEHSNEVLHGSPSHLNDSVTLDDLGNTHIPIGPGVHSCSMPWTMRTGFFCDQLVSS